ncbi:MAG: DUF3108 domain-containing protein [Candidatus Omnitrophota bacterium]
MKIKIIIIVSVIILIILCDNNLLRGEAGIYDYTGERIQYLIEPIGKSEYTDCGTVDLNGVTANLVTLKSKILFVEVMEKIFYDPESSLPYKTERTNSGLWIKEYRTEEYDQKKFTVVIKKFKGKKLVKERLIKSDGPIQNMNTLLFYLRKQPDFKIGWQFSAKVLNELKLVKFNLELISIDEIIVPGGKFQAYHFKSVPDTFEIWIDKSSPRIPLKIKIKGIVNCSLLMKGYSLRNN